MLEDSLEWKSDSSHSCPTIHCYEGEDFGVNAETRNQPKEGLSTYYSGAQALLQTLDFEMGQSLSSALRCYFCSIGELQSATAFKLSLTTGHVL